jgi:hypothetical protein
LFEAAITAAHSGGEDKQCGLHGVRLGKIATHGNDDFSAMWQLRILPIDESGFKKKNHHFVSSIFIQFWQFPREA